MALEYPKVSGTGNLWCPWLISSICNLTTSRLAEHDSEELPMSMRPKLRWQLTTGTVDVELTVTEPQSHSAARHQLTLWVNSDVYRSETEALALRGLALQHNLVYIKGGKNES